MALQSPIANFATERPDNLKIKLIDSSKYGNSNEWSIYDEDEVLLRSYNLKAGVPFNHTFKEPGNYMIQLVSNTDLCRDTLRKWVWTDYTSVPDIPLEIFSIYPNPTSGNINIIIEEGKTAGIEIYSLIGEKVATLENISGNFNGSLTHLAKGIYHLQLKIDEKLYDAKLSIE